jgi:hypothetical protein
LRGNGKGVFNEKEVRRALRGLKREDRMRLIALILECKSHHAHCKDITLVLMMFVLFLSLSARRHPSTNPPPREIPPFDIRHRGSLGSRYRLQNLETPERQRALTPRTCKPKFFPPL